MNKLTTHLACLLLLAAQPSFAQSLASLSGDCGAMTNHYGPYDYTNPTHVREKLPVVESAHFNLDVESLKRGKTAALPGGDLDYVLRAFPNHHRALYSMARYTLQHGDRPIPPGARYTGNCYFERAIRFSPDDPKVRMVYGIFFSFQKDYPQAIEQLQSAISIDVNNAEAHYNLGLMYERTDNIELALKHARRAYDLGFPLNGLKNKLKRRGAWSIASDSDPAAGNRS